MIQARNISRTLLPSIVCLLLLPAAAFAAEPVGHMSASPSAVQWQAGVDNEKIVLRVVAPDGTEFTKEFPSGSTPSFRLQDLGLGKISDGVYSYELLAVPRISPEVKRQLAAARAADDDVALERVQKAAHIGEAAKQSGTLTVANGMFLNSDAAEPRASVVRLPKSTSAATSAATSSAASTAATIHKIAPNDDVIADDLIVQGSACVGLDCVVNESFGFDTIRLKENNTRIKFDDTSTSTGFPNHNWQLTANDSASGGANKFSIEDITAATVPFTVTGSSPTNSLFVASNGKVGFGNAAPVLNLHVTATDTPAIRQEQTSGGGFTAWTWDIGANEANWFVRDVTSGSRLPLRIRPGAPTSSIDISASGNVGVGTASPSQKMHVFQTVDANSIVLSENTSNTTGANAAFQSKSDTAVLSFQSHATARTISRFGVTLGGWDEMLASAGNGLAIGTLGATPLILGTNSVNRLQIDGSTGAVTVSGNFTVTGTKNFAMPDPADAKKAIYYAALEGPEAGTYYRGTVKIVNGEAVIKLPGYFTRITEVERMTVQLTPVGAPGQLYVAERSPERIVIKTAKGTEDIEFDYLVQGVRKGYLNYEVVRDNNLPKE
jgi:hypothetical protein